MSLGGFVCLDNSFRYAFYLVYSKDRLRHSPPDFVATPHNASIIFEYAKSVMPEGSRSHRESRMLDLTAYGDWPVFKTLKLTSSPLIKVPKSMSILFRRGRIQRQSRCKRNIHGRIDGINDDKLIEGLRRRGSG